MFDYVYTYMCTCTCRNLLVCYTNTVKVQPSKERHQNLLQRGSYTLSRKNYTLSRKKEKRNREEEKSQGSTNHFMPQFLHGHVEGVKLGILY